MATLLNDPTIYEPLANDPTAPYKRKLINIIKRWQSQDPIPQQLKHRIYPQQKKYLRSMASSRSTNQISPSGRLLRAGGWGITYNATRVLADTLSPLVGQLERHVKNSSAFVDTIQDLEVPPGQ